MSTTRDRGRIELLQGTLDLLIPRTVRLGPAHEGPSENQAEAITRILRPTAEE